MDLVSTVFDVVKNLIAGNYYIAGGVAVYIALAFFKKEKREWVGRRLADLALWPLFRLFGAKLGVREGKNISKAILGVLDDLTNGFVARGAEIISKINGNNNGGDNNG